MAKKEKAVLTWTDKYGDRDVLEQGIGDDVFFATVDSEGNQSAVIIDKNKIIEFAEMLKVKQ